VLGVEVMIGILVGALVGMIVGVVFRAEVVAVVGVRLVLAEEDDSVGL